MKTFLELLNLARRASFPTKLVLGIVGATFLFANLAESPLIKELDVVGLGEDWNLVARYLFTRGWPLSPCMCCTMRGMKFHPDGFTWLALVVDVLLAVVTLNCYCRFD